MAKKTIGYMELYWHCPSCATQNLGSVQNCVSCGSHQPEGVAFEQIDTQDLLTDEDKIKAAKRAADMHCPFCGTRNSSDSDECQQCGGDLKDGIRRMQGQVLGAFGAGVPAAKDVLCPSCNQPNAAAAAFCINCGSHLQQAPRPQPVQAKPVSQPALETAPRQPKKFPIGVIILLAFLGIACAAIVLITVLAGGSREDITGTVTDLNWQRSIEVLEIQNVTRETWREEVPSGDRILNCEERLYRTQNEPAPGAYEVCGTPYTVDQGNGYAEVVQDCQYEIYADFCSYETQDWVLIDTLQASGNDQSAYWPDMNLSSTQTTGDEIEQYTITLNADGETYRYQTSDFTIFQQADFGSRWMINTGLFGAVKSIEAAD